MISIRWFRATLLMALATAVCGCDPLGSSQPDEEKEAHFQRGRERVNAMDYGGAVESFEKALEVNPHSGAAHFELGWLYADKQPDPASSIYHYQQYLKLRPRADNADTIRQHIFRQKQELAKVVLPLPPTPGVQRQLEQLMEENRRLAEEVEKWRAYYANRGVAPPTNAFVVNQGRSTTATPTSQTIQTNRPSTATRAATPTARTHRVQSGDTPSAIARKYNVKLDALLSANPNLDPRRMKVGQVLNIPPS